MGVNMDLKDKSLFIQKCFINGNWLDAESEETFDVMNPSDETKFKLLNESKLFVVPYTKNESFGVVILEAIFNGCVVICSDIPVFKNILKESGIYFDNKNSFSLNNSIKNTLNLDLDKIWKSQYKEVSRYKTELVMRSWIELYNTKMLGSNK